MCMANPTWKPLDRENLRKYTTSCHVHQQEVPTKSPLVKRSYKLAQKFARNFKKIHN